MDKVKVTKDLENMTLVVERAFDAPKAAIWKAYADKEMFQRWWGPEGWETTVKEFSMTPGGKIHYGMKCVDEKQGDFFGQESWGLMEIQDVEEGTSFTARDWFSDAEGNKNAEMPAQKFVVELIEEDGRTRLLSKSITETEEQLEELIKMGMVEGFASQLQKLETLLAS